MEKQKQKLIKLDESYHKMAKTEASMQGISLKEFIQKAIKDSLST